MIEWRACEEWKSKFYWSGSFMIGMASAAFDGDGLWVSWFCVYTIIISFLIFRVWLKKSCPNTHWWKALSLHRRKLHQIFQDFRRPAETYSNPHRYYCHPFFFFKLIHLGRFFFSLWSFCDFTYEISLCIFSFWGPVSSTAFQHGKHLLQIQHAFLGKSA